MKEMKKVFKLFMVMFMFMFNPLLLEPTRLANSAPEAMPIADNLSMEAESQVIEQIETNLIEQSLGNEINLAEQEELMRSTLQEPIEMHEVTFNWNFEGAPIETILIISGEPITFANIPEAPEREGFELSGWNEVMGDYPVDPWILSNELLAAYIVNHDVEFTAGWREIEIREEYEVRFDWNFEGAPIEEPILITSGEPITFANIPEAPEREGFEHIGWNIVPGDYPIEPELLSNERLASYIVNHNVEFTAAWREIEIREEYEVRFDWNFEGAPEVPPVLIVLGEEVGIDNIPITLEREGYDHLGWRIEGAGTILTAEQVASRVVTGDVEFIAAWLAEGDELEVYEVTFNWDFAGAPTVQLVLVEYGTAVGLVNIPSAPVRAGYNHLGWQVEGEGAILS